MIYRKLQILELGDGHLPAGTRQVPATPDSNPPTSPADEPETTMLQRNPHRPRHAAARPRTAVVLGRLVLAGLALASFVSVANAYFNR